jgi:calmodulin
MAIKNMNTVATRSTNMATRALDGDMTVDEFKEWIKCFDMDKDGRISRQELRRAIKVIHGRFSGLKSRKGIRVSDTDGDGYINEDEIDNLIDFAQQSLGLKIVAY